MLRAMYAVVVGAGEVGFHIAAILSREGHEVAVVDRDSEICRRAGEELDVLAVTGNGASRITLAQVGVDRADLLIAVTDSDEVNMIACMAAKQIGVPQTVARVRNQEYVDDVGGLAPGFAGVNHVIRPESAVADEVVKLALLPGALDVEMFAHDQVSMVEVQVDPASSVLGIPLRALRLPEGVLVTAILRDGQLSVPRGDSMLEARDRVFLTGEAEATIVAAGRLTGQHGVPKRAILMGCGEIGVRVALGLEERRVRLTVFEKDVDRAAIAAGTLRRSLVIHDEGIDEAVLIREGVEGADLFVAATGDDRLNILTALLAKQLGAKRTISIVERSEFSRILESVGVDVALSPRRMTASAILRFVRAGVVVSAAVLDKLSGEVLEFEVKATSPVCGRRLADVEFPEGAIVGALVHEDRVGVPDGRTEPVEGDVAVVFALPKAVRGVEKLFAPRTKR